MSTIKIWVTWILIITSLINMIFGIVLIAQALKKEWPSFISGAIVLSMNAGLALGTSCLEIEWILWMVSVISFCLSIYFSVVVSHYINVRVPAHEERLWKHYVYSGKIHDLERKYSCCGRDGPNFYTHNNNLRVVPPSCLMEGSSPDDKKIWQRGCFYLMEQKSEEAIAQLMYYMIAIAVIGFIQGIAAQILAILLLAKKKKSKNKNLAASDTSDAYKQSVEVPRHRSGRRLKDESSGLEDSKLDSQKKQKSRTDEPQLVATDKTKKETDNLAVENKFLFQEQTEASTSKPNDNEEINTPADMPIQTADNTPAHEKIKNQTQNKTDAGTQSDISINAVNPQLKKGVGIQSSSKKKERTESKESISSGN